MIKAQQRRYPAVPAVITTLNNGAKLRNALSVGKSATDCGNGSRLEMAPSSNSSQTRNRNGTRNSEIVRLMQPVRSHFKKVTAKLVTTTKSLGRRICTSLRTKPIGAQHAAARSDGVFLKGVFQSPLTVAEDVPSQVLKDLPPQVPELNVKNALAADANATNDTVTITTHETGYWPLKATEPTTQHIPKCLVCPEPRSTLPEPERSMCHKPDRVRLVDSFDTVMARIRPAKTLM